jgi:hypothetical protein
MLNSVLCGSELFATVMDSIVEGPSFNEDTGKAVLELRSNHSYANFINQKLRTNVAYRLDD